MNIKTLGAAVVAGMVIAGCTAKEESVDTVALSVNGAKLMQSKIDSDVAAILKAQGDKIPAAQQEYAKQSFANQIAQSFIFEKVLLAKAKAEGFTVTDADRKKREDEFLKAVAKMPDAPKTLEDYFKKFPLGEERARAEFENGILIDKLLKAEQAKVPAKDYAAEAQKMIDGIVAENAKAANAEGDALKKIKDLKAQLDKVSAKDLPAKFAELAKANSACPSSAKGGDLGAFTHGQMVKEFDEVAFKLPVNKVSEPVKTQFGYHLIMTTKKIPEVKAQGDKPAEPEKVQASHILVKAAQKRDVPKKDDVVKYLKNNAERQFVQEYIMKQVKTAKIEASEKFKQFVPPADEPKAAPAAKAPAKAPAKAASAPVEKPVKK
jgi:parvulin-like peptidyl-prolyl isomerase